MADHMGHLCPGFPLTRLTTPCQGFCGQNSSQAVKLDRKGRNIGWQEGGVALMSQAGTCIQMNECLINCLCSGTSAFKQIKVKKRWKVSEFPATSIQMYYRKSI